MRDEVAIKVLKDILPATDSHIRRAILKAISSLKADRTLTVIVNIGDMFKGMSNSGPPTGFDMFSKENLDKLFGGESDGV